MGTALTRYEVAWRYGGIVVLIIVVAALYATAPMDGNFWWSDAPRHALNGVFVKDLLRDLPLSDPAGYAQGYYVKYPALTILFYPPLFYLLSAPFYALLGVSQATAMLVVSLHVFAFGLGVFALARLWLRAPIALAVAVAAIMAPEVALWGRQVMLELPAFAFVVWAIWAAVRYERAGKPYLLYLAAGLLTAALYTKLTVVFVIPVLALLLFRREGFMLLRSRHAWIAAGLFVLSLAPLAAMTILFGQSNVQSVAGIADAPVERWSVAGWLWYLRLLPDELGWPMLGLGALGAILALIRNRTSFDRRFAVTLAAWFAVGYVFLSLIDLKEARHSIFILLPIIFSAGYATSRLLPERVAPACAITAAFAYCINTLAFHPVPHVDGYREAAEFVAAVAPKNSVILFSGKRDGSFVFAMRQLESRADLSTVRADKLLLQVAVRRELGVAEKAYSEAEIADLIGHLGVYYVVAQTDFWTDLEQMRRLQSVLRSNRFDVVKRITIRSNLPTEDREVVIYRNLGPVATGPIHLQLDLPIIKHSVEGTVGQ